ncbi:hypothetical protein CSC2_44940 [Clostridium zeae]|uniref:Heparin-sulfate lyase N-terminal domain-containing protein n=1 Tax=Clostridium zeae TaxID=2759022 RepID=A0ABQ1EGK6_9CLOT|nr:heparinase II/III family protein [Clostridium zeae]GFZ33968.1 hypothetical protein CSC2_44940 [Clostridium zeae]
MRLDNIKNKLHKLYDIIKDYIYTENIQNNNTNINNIINLQMLSKFTDENISSSELEYVVKRYMNHEFDLLGSGWVKASYKFDSFGSNGILYRNKFNNLERDQIIRRTIIFKKRKKSKLLASKIQKSYEMINWARDYKSGYTYNTKLHKNLIKPGKPFGSEIKFPWELSRMHHLVQMSIFSLIDGSLSKDLIEEFKNQTLDFFSTNPKPFGVNWVCPMDVGIRIVNILIAYDIFTQLDSSNVIESNFKEILAQEVVNHLDFVYNNLENKGVPGNHYLANLAALIIGGIYISNEYALNKYLELGIKEFINQIDIQFNSDGSNFEASTAYHNLSFEIMTVTILYILRLLELNPKIEKDFKNIDKNYLLDKLYKALQFNIDMLKDNDKIIQIGDNDSGRFIKLTTTGEFLDENKYKNRYKSLENYEYSLRLFFDENMLNNKSTSALASAFFDIRYNEFPVEYFFVKSIYNHNNPTKYTKNYLDSFYEDDDIIKQLEYKKERVFDVQLGSKDDREVKYYKDFGLAIVSSVNWKIYLFAGPVGYEGLGAHSHNDKLNIEFVYEGQDILYDSGAYLYTSSESNRNEFRSSIKHNIPIPLYDEQEQNIFFHMFGTRCETSCRFIEVSNTTVSAVCGYRNKTFFRQLIIEDDKLIIRDFANVEFFQNFNDSSFSNGYGKLMN